MVVGGGDQWQTAWYCHVVQSWLLLSCCTVPSSGVWRCPVVLTGGRLGGVVMLYSAVYCCHAAQCPLVAGDGGKWWCPMADWVVLSCCTVPSIAVTLHSALWWRVVATGGRLVADICESLQWQGEADAEWRGTCALQELRYN